jgi:hypothetical protein
VKAKNTESYPDHQGHLVWSNTTWKPMNKGGVTPETACAAEQPPKITGPSGKGREQRPTENTTPGKSYANARGNKVNVTPATACAARPPAKDPYTEILNLVAALSMTTTAKKPSTLNIRASGTDDETACGQELPTGSPTHPAIGKRRTHCTNPGNSR